VGGEKNNQHFNKKGGGKNAPHANPKKREAARENYEKAKEDYNRLKKLKRDPDIKRKMKEADKQMKHWKREMDFTGENHSRNAKGNR